MSRDADRSTPERRCVWLAALVALAVGGCGATSDALSRAARASQATTRLSQNVTRAWCPQAVAGGGRRLTEVQARDCLHRAWDAWLRELRHDGYDPTRVGR